MKKLILIFVAFLLSFSAIFADEPMSSLSAIFDDEAPTYYTTFPNGKFFLGCNSGKNTTTCFEMTGKGKKEKWEINDFSNCAQVSSNGKFCILDNTEGLVTTDYTADTVLFKVYKNR